MNFNFKGALYLTTLTVGVAVATTILHHLASIPIYSGPIDAEGVERVEVIPQYELGRGGTLSTRGNSINITLTEGEEVKVRDYNRNFRMDEEDTVIPANPLLDLTTILAQTEVKVAEVYARRDSI